MQGRPSQGEGLQQKKKGEKEKREKEQQEAAERERNKKEEEATATQSVPKGKAKGQKKGEATFPCQLLVHKKTCNRGDQCSYGHDASLVKRFQQAEFTIRGVLSTASAPDAFTGSTICRRLLRNR